MEILEKIIKEMEHLREILFEILRNLFKNPK